MNELKYINIPYKPTYARYTGKCALSGNDFPSGTPIMKIDKVGWAMISEVRSHNANLNKVSEEVKPEVNQGPIGEFDVWGKILEKHIGKELTSHFKYDGLVDVLDLDNFDRTYKVVQVKNIVNNYRLFISVVHNFVMTPMVRRDTKGQIVHMEKQVGRIETDDENLMENIVGDWDEYDAMARAKKANGEL